MAVDALINMNLMRLLVKLRLPDDEFEQWFKDLGLLHGRRSCKNCGNEMHLYSAGHGNANRAWICKRRACRSISGNKIGFKVGTFFECSRVELKKVIHLSYYYLHHLGTYEQMEYEVELSTASIVQWVRNFQHIFALHLLANESTVGGPGTIVEVDGTSISARKFHDRSFPVNDRQWMFGGFERGTKKSFLKLVETCDPTTLLPIIQESVLPGTTIMSDLWEAYGGIYCLPVNYQHLTVSNGYKYVDPLKGSHIQAVGNNWSRYKRKIRKVQGSNTEENVRYSDCLQEFMWREKYPVKGELLYHFWKQVAELYPCEQ